MAEAKAQEHSNAQTSYTLRELSSKTFSAGLALPGGPPNPQAGRLRSAVEILQLCPHWLEQDAFLEQVPNAVPGKRAGSGWIGSLSFWQGSVSHHGCEGQGFELRAT